jgi:hypothetical protein
MIFIVINKFQINLKMTAPKKTNVDVKPNVLPITFKEFSKDPVKGLLFIVLLAIGYLYVDGKMNYMSQIKTQNSKIEVLESKVDLLTLQLRKSDSTLSAATSKISVLQELGKIK